MRLLYGMGEKERAELSDGSTRMMCRCDRTPIVTSLLPLSNSRARGRGQ